MSPDTRALIGLLADYAQILSVVGPSLYFVVRFFKKNQIPGPRAFFKKNPLGDIRTAFGNSTPIKLDIARSLFKKIISRCTKSQNRTVPDNVVIVGLGGVGSRIVEQFSRLGVHSLTLIDPDVVSLKKTHLA